MTFFLEVLGRFQIDDKDSSDNNNNDNMSDNNDNNTSYDKLSKIQYFPAMHDARACF